MRSPIFRSGVNAPQVPNRTNVKEVFCAFSVRVSKSILNNASISLTTISILSVPIPVETTLIRLPRNVPVMVWNSRLETSHAILSKWVATCCTRPGSPTNIIVVANCPGHRCKWKIEPSWLIINSEGAMVLIKENSNFVFGINVINLRQNS